MLIAGCSCGLSETRQDTHTWGCCGPCPVLLFAGLLFRVQRPREQSQTWGVFAPEASLQGLSQASTAVRICRAWLNPCPPPEGQARTPAGPWPSLAQEAVTGLDELLLLLNPALDRLPDESWHMVFFFFHFFLYKIVLFCLQQGGFRDKKNIFLALTSRNVNAVGNFRNDGPNRIGVCPRSQSSRQQGWATHGRA